MSDGGEKCAETCPECGKAGEFHCYCNPHTSGCIVFCENDHEWEMGEGKPAPKPEGEAGEEPMRDWEKPDEVAIERALLLADDENENSISSGKSFNSQGWAKKVLAAAYRAEKAKREELEKTLKFEAAGHDEANRRAIAFERKSDDLAARVRDTAEILGKAEAAMNLASAYLGRKSEKDGVEWNTERYHEHQLMIAAGACGRLRVLLLEESK